MTNKPSSVYTTDHVIIGFLVDPRFDTTNDLLRYDLPQYYYGGSHYVGFEIERGTSSDEIMRRATLVYRVTGRRPMLHMIRTTTEVWREVVFHEEDGEIRV